MFFKLNFGVNLGMILTVGKKIQIWILEKAL